jgi:integron integrase
MEAKPKLLDAVREKVRALHYSYRTEQQYIRWIRRFILHHNKRHPAELGAPEVESFLTYLAVVGHVSASTQNQGLSAILFLYRDVLGVDLPWLQGVVRARAPIRVPVVLTRREVQALLDCLEGPLHMIGQLLYGSGLRLMEALRLRVKDIDFDYAQIVVRDGKGQKDRVTILPEAAAEAMHKHLERVREKHEDAMRGGYGGVDLPDALDRKYRRAALAWSWQYVFPAERASAATTSARCRSLWATPTCAPRRSTRT